MWNNTKFVKKYWSNLSNILHSYREHVDIWSLEWHLVNEWMNLLKIALTSVWRVITKTATEWSSIYHHVRHDKMQISMSIGWSISRRSENEPAPGIKRSDRADVFEPTHRNIAFTRQGGNETGNVALISRPIHREVTRICIYSRYILFYLIY